MAARISMGEPTARPAPTTAAPASAPLSGSLPESALTLLGQAEQGLADAERDTEPGGRFAAAYLAAFRAAAALLAVRGRPHGGSSRPVSVWTLLASVAPELREWAAFFASCSATRASVQAGITRVVTTRSADDLLRQAEQFVELVTRALQPRVPGARTES